jgi:hypothetical protein
VSARAADSAETIDTLKYAERARHIRTRPVANVCSAIDPARQELLVAELTAALKERSAAVEATRARYEATIAEQLAEHEATVEQLQDAFADERSAFESELTSQLLAQREELEGEHSSTVRALLLAHQRQMEAQQAAHALALEQQREALSRADAARACSQGAVADQNGKEEGAEQNGRLLELSRVLSKLHEVLSDEQTDGVPLQHDLSDLEAVTSVSSTLRTVHASALAAAHSG